MNNAAGQLSLSSRADSCVGCWSCNVAVRDLIARKGQSFGQEVGTQARRRMRARSSNRPVWLGLGMFGLVGWSIAIPTLIGVALGRWLDRGAQAGHGRTMALLVAGLCVGCAIAWH